MKEKQIRVFHNGVYSNKIRGVYEDLLCIGLSTRKIESAIRVVLKGLVGIDVGRLPKETFAKFMLLEARGLAQIHVLSELAGEEFEENEGENIEKASKFSTLNTLYSDGTSKKGHSFMTYDITTNKGESLVLGLRPIAAQDAQSQLDVFKEVLDDIGNFSSDENFVARTFASIKNVMSDRCATQKKFNRIFTEYRETVIPSVQENWQTLTVDEQKDLAKVNQFFCGLHFIVALADQAEASLKVWEKLLYGKEKVGSLAKGGYSSGDSGTTRLIKTI